MTRRDSASASSSGQDSQQTAHSIGIVVLVVAFSLALVFLISGGATAAGPTTEEAVVVDIHENGDAALTLTIPFDLTVSEEQAAFEEFRVDEDRQATLVERYETQISNVATELDTATDREMAVTNPRLASSTDDSETTGVIHITVTWEQLAATDGDKLRLAAPFDSGFAPDRQMIVEAPDGHQIVAATPEPTVEDDRAIWGADQQLDSFSVTIDAVEGTDGKDSDDSGQAGTAGATSPDDTGAGFGFLLSALTLGGLLLVTRLRE